MLFRSRKQNAPREAREAFLDPRLHFAVNCASIGCPDLQPEVFTGANLDRLYDKGVRGFMDTPSKYRFEDGTFHISKLMDWYGDDFEIVDPASDEAIANLRDNGVEQAEKVAAVAKFFANYEERDEVAESLRSGDFSLQWLEYDWALNGE